MRISHVRRRRSTVPSIVAICLAAGLTVACGGPKHDLARVSTVGSSIAVVDYSAPAPELWTGSVNVSDDDVITAVIDAGARVARETEARKARARLDSAAVQLDVRARLSQRTLERAARYLGSRAVDSIDEADYLLEVYVRSYGLDARGSRGARVFMKTETVLIDRRTGREVWTVRVNSHDRITPSVSGGASIPAAVVTAGSLHMVSTEELRQELGSLTDFTADYATNELRDDLKDVRRR